MSGIELLDLTSDIHHRDTIRTDADTDEAWNLDRSVAVIITAPASIYDPNRESLEGRWTSLADEFHIELSRLFHNAFRTFEFSCQREQYRRIPPDIGGMFPELSELQAVTSNANALVQNLSGWITLADLARQLPVLWAMVVSHRGESGRPNDLPDPPILSKPLIRALCIADLEQKYGIQDLPLLAHEVRSDTLGSERHPVGNEQHVIAASFGSEIQQTVVYLVSSSGMLVEKFCITSGENLKLDLLNASWIGGRDRFAGS